MAEDKNEIIGWMLPCVGGNEIISNIESGNAAKVLACIGSGDKLKYTYKTAPKAHDSG